jgi:F-type H+-transporting ATPase subunit b
MESFLGDANNWVLISFVIFAIGFLRFGKGALIAKLDARIAEIRKEIETAESLRIEAQELLAQYQRKQRDAAREAETIVAHARESAAHIRREAEAEMKETLKRREEQMNDRLKRAEEKAVNDIRAYAAELAVRATREIIVTEMDESTNGSLVDKSIKSVTGKLAA